MKGDGFFSKFGHRSKGVVAGLALAFGVVAPRKAEAYTIAADGTFVEQSAPAPDFVRMGLGAGVAAGTFAGGVAVSIKKERKQLQQELDVMDKELTRLDSFKQEFLDGVPSDNSLLSSLNKAMNTAPAAVEDDDEDEFEKNVRMFLEEEQKKEEKKNPHGNGKAPSTLLERPSDPNGEEVEEWMNDVVFEDKPAEIDDAQLQALQRMFGGGDSSADKK